MSYLWQKWKKVGVTHFVSVLKRVENYPDFEKLPVHLTPMVFRGL